MKRSMFAKQWGLFVCVVLCLPVYAQKVTVRVGAIDYPPHVQFAEASDKSPLIKYMATVLSSAGFEMEVIKFPGGRGKLELARGQVDLLLPVEATSGGLSLFEQPIFHATPGLCFKKENFIPILSATHRFKGLTVGIPAGSQPLPVLVKSGAILVDVTGEDATERAIELTQRGRLLAAYHPSPRKIYHSKNPLYKELACSYFNGYSSPVFIAASKDLPESVFNALEISYSAVFADMSYEFYLSTSKQ